jgi:hypothetical protein
MRVAWQILAGLQREVGWWCGHGKPTRSNIRAWVLSAFIHRCSDIGPQSISQDFKSSLIVYRYFVIISAVSVVSSRHATLRHTQGDEGNFGRTNGILPSLYGEPQASILFISNYNRLPQLRDSNCKHNSGESPFILLQDRSIFALSSSSQA